MANYRDKSRQIIRTLINITDPNKAEVICLVSILTITAAGIIQELNSKYTLLQTIMTFLCLLSVIITLTYLFIAVLIELYIDSNFNNIDTSNRSQEDLDSIEDDFEANVKDELKTDEAFYDLFSPCDHFTYANPMSIDLSSTDEVVCLKAISPFKLKDRPLVDSPQRKTINSLSLEKNFLANKNSRQKPSLIRNSNLYRTKSSELSLPPATFDVSEVTEKMKFKQDKPVMPKRPVMPAPSEICLRSLTRPMQDKKCEPNQCRNSIMNSNQDRKSSSIDKRLNSVSFFSMSFDNDDSNVLNEAIADNTETITESINEQIPTELTVSCRENRSIHELSSIHRKKLEVLKTLRKTNYRNTLMQCETVTYDSSQDPIIIMGSSYGELLPNNN
jgi:hypothetical protein